jgi:hypothetical protein
MYVLVAFKNGCMHGKYTDIYNVSMALIGACELWQLKHDSSGIVCSQNIAAYVKKY